MTFTIDVMNYMNNVCHVGSLFIFRKYSDFFIRANKNYENYGNFSLIHVDRQFFYHPLLPTVQSINLPATITHSCFGTTFIVTFRAFIDTCFATSTFKFNFTSEANIPDYPTLNIF